MSKRVLITGGTGYIGSHTAVELIEAGYEVVILDNLFNSKIEVLEKIGKIADVVPFYKVDLMDAEAVDKVFEKGKFDTVIHFAGLKAVGESVEKPLTYYENNIGGTVNLLKAMEKYGCNESIFSSSATVYGDPGKPEYVETMRTGQDISSPYGKTKYMIEEILKDATVANPKLSVVTLRYFNPIGAHPSGLLGEDPNGIPNNLMPIVMKVARKEIPKLAVYGDDYPTPDGTCRRDYIHVVDLSKGHLAAMQALKPGFNVYNLGSGKPNSVLEIVSAFEKASGKKLPRKIVKRRPGDLAEFWANPDKAEKELGWKTELTVDDAMEDTIRYLKNEENA